MELKRVERTSGGPGAAAGLTLAIVCAALPLVGSASAGGKPHWSRVDFTEATHQGEMRVLITTSGKLPTRRLADIQIWMNGRELRVPMRAAMRVTNPHLHDVDVSYIGSINCYFDDCPDVTQWPATVFIPFGEPKVGGQRSSPDLPEPNINRCDGDYLTIDVLAEAIAQIELSTCGEKGTESRTLYQLE